MPSAGLLLQALASGVFLGALSSGFAPGSLQLIDNGGWGINAAFIGGGFMLFACGLLGIIAVRRGGLTD